MIVSICRNGKEIGTTAAENINWEIENEQIMAGNFRVLTYPKSRTMYVRIQDVTFNDQEIELSPLDTYEFCADYFKLPKGVRKPKKKRIFNKYKKKYTNKFFWKHCQIRFEKVFEFSS